MALFDTKTVGALDDTVTLSAVIESAENIHGYTEYVIKVTRGLAQQAPTWTVRRRFRDFVSLNTKLTKNVPYLDLPLPPKKVFGNLNREFVAQRTNDLQVYLNTILSVVYLALSRDVKIFLDPKNYSENFADLSLQNVAMCMRGLQAVSVHKMLQNVGWRLRKTYFLAKSVERSKEERNLLAWTFYGPDFCLDYADAQLVLDWLCKVKHSLISSPQSAFCTEKGVVVVKGPLKSNGTLRDVLCNAKPERPFIQKYICPREPNCFDIRQLQLLGRKILEALKLLKEKNIPFFHLHTGNLIVTSDDRIQILDMENVVLGLPPLYRAYMVQCKAVKSLEDVIVYSFGHAFYECIFGMPLNQAQLANEPLPSECPAAFASFLRSILSQEATQNGLPTLNDLLSQDVFVPTWYQTISNCEDMEIKVPSKIKQLLSRCQDAFMERLRQDQAEYRRCIKMKRAEDYINSEEQKRLRKRAVRMAAKDTTSSSLPYEDTTRTGPGVSTNSGSSHHTAALTLGLNNGGDTARQRNSSANSGQSATSAVTPSPPPPPPPPAPPPPPPSSLLAPASSPTPTADGDRSAFLASIRDFSTTRLKKAVTVDKSGPKV